MTPTALLRTSFPGPANAGLRARIRAILADDDSRKGERIRGLATTVALTAQGRAKLDEVASAVAEPPRRYVLSYDAAPGHGGRTLLALDLDAGSYGTGALLVWPAIARNEHDDPLSRLGPADPLYGPDWTAAHAVASWALMPRRSPEEVAAARAFLAQWPGGPQLPTPAATLGARGGAAGTGASKRRSSEQYREMARRSAAARRAGKP